MNAVRQSGKRFLLGILICGGIALPGLPAAHAATAAPAIQGQRAHNPCQGILNQIDALSPADFPAPHQIQEYQAAMRALLAQLRTCEARH